MTSIKQYQANEIDVVRVLRTLADDLEKLAKESTPEAFEARIKKYMEDAEKARLKQTAKTGVVIEFNDDVTEWFAWEEHAPAHAGWYEVVPGLRWYYANHSWSGPKGEYVDPPKYWRGLRSKP